MYETREIIEEIYNHNIEILSVTQIIGSDAVNDSISNGNLEWMREQLVGEWLEND